MKAHQPIRSTVQCLVCLATAIFAAQVSLAEAVPDDIEVVWSNPADNFVDVRSDRDLAGESLGIMRVELVFNQSVSLSMKSIELLSNAEAPSIVDIYGRGDYWTVVFDKPITSGATTVLSIGGGRAFVTLQSRPGDVNLDGVSDTLDVAALKEALASTPRFAAQFDIDRDGVFAAADVVRLDEILAGDDGGVAWAQISFPPIETAQCCCSSGSCFVNGRACPAGTTQTTCPCTPNPCGYGGG